MNRFEDFVVESLPEKWQVSAYDCQNEEVHTIDVSWHELLGFTREFYGMTRAEATYHLGRCEEHEAENLLKELFKSKYK